MTAYTPRRQYGGGTAFAPVMPDQFELSARVMTGHNLYCQRDHCQQIVDAGGDCLFLDKANRAQLVDGLKLLFDPSMPFPPLLE